MARRRRKSRRTTEKPSAPITQELTAAGGGAAYDGGSIYASTLAKNPEDIVQASKGGGLKLYEEVLTDDQVFSNFQQRRLALLSKEIEIQPGDTDKQSKAAADFLREQICALDFDSISNKMMYGVFYGYGVAECLWGKDGRHWALDDIKVRKAGRFRYDKQGGLRLIKQGHPQGILMEERKFWTFESGSSHHDNPYGVALASRCYWPTFFKRNGIRFWLLALEKYGAPTAVGKYPVNATASDKKKFLETVTAFASMSGVTIPEGMNIELLSAGGKVGGNHDEMVKQMDKAISKVILSQTMTTDDGSSQAQASVHFDVREDIIKADAHLQCASFMRGAGNWLMEWNYPQATAPVFRRRIEEEEDLDKKADRDYKLYQMGYRPTPQHILETYGEGYERVTPPDAGEGAQDDQDQAPQTPASFSEGEDETGSDPVEDFIDDPEHLELLDNEVDEIIGELESRLSQATTAQEVKDILASFATVPDTDAFTDRLTRSTFNARLHGRAVRDT